MKLLKEFAARGDVQADLKVSDGSDAGRDDTAAKPTDIKFSLMRNMINTDGGVTGSDVNDYLERAQDLNDEVDTVGFAIETDDGDLIKIYVNANEADEFEQELSKLLGLDDDSEAAINQLAQKFDIVDVVWPTDPEAENAEDPYSSVSIDDDPSAFLDDTESSVDSSETNTVPDDELDVDSTEDEEENTLPADDEPAKSKSSLMKDVSAAADEKKSVDQDDEVEAPADDAEETESDEDTESDDEGDATSDKDASEDGDDAVDDEDTDVTDDNDLDDETTDELDDDEPELDADGNPVRKKKSKKEPELAEEGLSEDARAEIDLHIAAALERGHRGKFSIQGLATGGSYGRREFQYKRDGQVVYFENQEEAEETARRLTREKNMAGARAHFSYTVKLNEDWGSSDWYSVIKHMKESIERGLSLEDAAHDAALIWYDHMGYESAEDAEPSIIHVFKLRTGMKEEQMTVGSKFLDRLMEAESDVKLDTPWTGLRNRLKRPYEKKIVEFFSLLGIPGRYVVNEEGLEDAIRAGADVIRRPGRKQSTFNALYDALKATSTVTEAKKRGNRVQKILETVMVALGFPAALVTTDGAGTLASTLSRAARKFESNSSMEDALIAFAKALGITSAQVNEDVDVGTDEFFQKVVLLAQALGIPERNLQFQRPILVKSLREKKLALGNRGMIEQRMDQLMALIAKATRPQAGQEVNKLPEALKEGLLMEAFGPLEALTASSLQHFNAEEPAAGPAMMAAYEGGGSHEDTVMFVCVDPDADNEAKSLRVSIDGPWDGMLHAKYFPNNKDGYKAALDYANMLRTANLKTGGRPKTWKEAK